MSSPKKLPYDPFDFAQPFVLQQGKEIMEKLIDRVGNKKSL